MAKFIKIWESMYNIDWIVKAEYNAVKDVTIICFGNGTDQLEIPGDQTREIQGLSNEATMHDRHLANILLDKFKVPLSDIISKLDKLSKAIETIAKNNKR